MVKNSSNRTPNEALSLDTRAILEEMLLRCRDAAETCFTLDEEEWGGDAKLEGFLIAARLIKTSLMLAAALEGSRGEFVHRIVVERRTDAGAIPPPSENPKTIHRVIEPGGAQD